jgi:methyl-accepting chemotaxis protein
MKSEQQKQIDSARKAMEQAKQQAGDTPIAGALVFDCVCRGLILEERFSEAVEEFKKVLGPNVPILGWETYGEVCMHPGEFSGFHNTTSVVMLLP